MLRYIRHLIKNIVIHLFGKIFDFKLYIAYLKYRIRYRKQPFLHSHDGAVELGEKLCVFSLYQPKGIPDSVLYQLNAIRELGFAPLVISNGKLPQKDIEKLEPLVWKLYERPNIGRDFGGFKLGILAIENSILPNLKRLMLANDSVFGPLHDLRGAYESMDNTKCDYWGINENLEFGNHVASYFLVFKESVLTSNYFINYWKKYKEKSSRRHTIRRGEIGLNQTLRQANMKPGVLCPSKKFQEVLASLPSTQDLLCLMAKTSFALDAWDQVASIQSSQVPEKYDQFAREMLYRMAVKTFESSNTAGDFAIAMNRNLHCPFLKRDIISTSIIEVGTLLSNLTVSTDFPIEDIEFEYRIKGTKSDLPLHLKVLKAGGYI